MEQTALRPKPMPGQEPGGGRKSGSARRPHAARRRGRRLTTLLFGLFVAAVLVLTGVGLGTVGVTVIGMSRLAELQRQAGGPGVPGQAASGPGAPGQDGQRTRTGPSVPESANPSASAPARRRAPVTATLGLEAVDAEKSGAMVVGVHVPGPGFTAGLVRGDVLLVVGRTRIDTAADLARAVAGARPGREVVLTVRHRGGGYQQLTAVPGVVT
ncbi:MULTISPECIES: PDZ domain-containing protein [Streptomyces]|uniref:PDZ domain-containing protein n=1 Tax=Streptomyces doebereineriae TaxID=3075528 RepID=A0ABU2VAC2_9ACTN|nr:PDZ domain-containing protein [Streptomyces sp. DSM 41640]MDT0482512.1 PDZ domain-containing protein [Streptomyces sp. DSM 41640]